MPYGMNRAVVTHTVVACSWACAAGLASSLDEAEPADAEVPW